MKKIIVGLVYLVGVVLIGSGIRMAAGSIISNNNDLKFQKDYAVTRCHNSAQEIVGVTGEKIIERYGSYYCYVQVKGNWTNLTEYDMDKILKIRQ
jgi:hypothetical protein